MKNITYNKAEGYTLDKESQWIDGLRIESTVLGKDMIETSSVRVAKDGIYDLKLLNIDENPVVNVYTKSRFKDMTRDDFEWDDYDGYHNRKLSDIKSRMEKGGIQAIEPVIFDYENGKITQIDGHHRGVIANELGLKQIYAYVRRSKSLEKPV